MKRILMIIIGFLIMCPLTVSAASYKLSLSTSSTSVKAGETVDIEVSLTNISGILEGLNVCQAKIYTSNVTVDEIIGNSDWNVTNGNVLIMDSAEGVTSNTKIATIQAKINAAGMISLSDIMCTDGEKEYSTSNSSISFSVEQEPEEQVNNSKLSIVVVDANDGQKILEGVELRIVSTSGREIKSWKTTDQSYTITGVELGKYYLEVKNVPDGYSINKEKLEFEIISKQQILNLSIKINPKVKVPDTLSNISKWFVIFGVISVCIGSMIIYKKYRQEKN